MAVLFLNPTRQFDESVNCMRFSGYDGAIEVSFFLEMAALTKISPSMNLVETDILAAFDQALKKIHKVASKVYQQNKRTYVCTLTANDF